jgi:hypothetical protein
MKPTLCLAAALACGLFAFAAPQQDFHPTTPLDAELLDLRRDFHLANSLGDYDLMLSLWTDDAIFSAAPGTFVGPEAITDFLASSPYWGTAANLTSESKGGFVRRGNEADFQFECIIVHVNGADPLKTSLSTLPPGAQNPIVEIVQHSNTQGRAVYEDGRWKFETFNGSGGAIQ